jgi:hypothetical protein
MLLLAFLGGEGGEGRFEREKFRERTITNRQERKKENI